MGGIKIFFMLLFFSTVAFAEVVLDRSNLDLEYYQKFQDSNITLNVYNWGEFIADGEDGSLDINKAFTELTGINVNYTTYDSNEEMLGQIRQGDISYDVAMPSDYMTEKLIQTDLIYKLDFSQIPNYKNISDDFIAPDYDPTGEYSLPYAWGMTGIIYNSNAVDIPEDEIDWGLLFDKQYKGKILMYAEPRYAFSVGAAYLGYSINTTNENELKHIVSVLKEQRSLVRAYVADEIYEKMASDKAALATYYAGDSLNMMESNPDLNFVIPKHGANLFTDTVVIPKNSQNIEAAHMYINFLNEPFVAAENIKYIKYASANGAAIELLPDDIRNNKLIYPSEDILENSEVLLSLPYNTTELMNSLWDDMFLGKNIKGFKYITPMILMLTVIISFIIVNITKKRKH